MVKGIPTRILSPCPLTFARNIGMLILTLITLTYGDQGPKRKAYSRCYWDFPLPTFAWPAMAQQTAKNTTARGDQLSKTVMEEIQRKTRVKAGQNVSAMQRPACALQPPRFS